MTGVQTCALPISSPPIELPQVHGSYDNDNETLSQIEQDLASNNSAVSLPETVQSVISAPSESPESFQPPMPEPPAWEPPKPTDTNELDVARNAVMSAVDNVPFDPASAGPVTALNAQPLGSGDINNQTPVASIQMPSIEPLSDESTLSIPGLSYEPTPSEPAPKADNTPDDGPAPPPVPPPLPMQ